MSQNKSKSKKGYGISRPPLSYRQNYAVGGPYLNINPYNPAGESDFDVLYKGHDANFDFSDRQERRQDRRQTGRNIGSFMYGTAEGLLDTVSFGLTDKLTDRGYDKLSQVGRGQTDAQARQSDRWRATGQVGGAVTSSILTGGLTTGSAISTTDVGNFANEGPEELQKGLDIASTVVGTAMGSTGAGGTGTASKSFMNSGVGNVIGKLGETSSLAGTGTGIENLMNAYTPGLGEGLGNIKEMSGSFADFQAGNPNGNFMDYLAKVIQDNPDLINNIAGQFGGQRQFRYGGNLSYKPMANGGPIDPKKTSDTQKPSVTLPIYDASAGVHRGAVDEQGNELPFLLPEAEVVTYKDDSPLAGVDQAIAKTGAGALGAYDPSSPEVQAFEKGMNEARNEFATNFGPFFYGALGVTALPLLAPMATESLGPLGEAAYPYITRAMHHTPKIAGYTSPLNVGQTIGGLFGIKGANTLGKDIDSGYYSDPNISGWDKFGHGTMTGLELSGTPGMGNALRGAGSLITNIPRYANQFGKYLTTQTPLSQTYKLNPWSYHNNTPSNVMFRGLGQPGVDDALTSGVFRPKPANLIPAKNLTTDLGTFDMAKRFKSTYYSPYLKTADNYGQGFIAEVPKDAAKFYSRYKGSSWSQYTPTQIPVNQGRILEKHWLHGYKPINLNTSVGAGKNANISLGGPATYSDKYYGLASSKLYDKLLNIPGVAKYAQRLPGHLGGRATARVGSTTIDKEGPRMFKEISSPEGRRRLETMFQEERALNNQPPLTDFQLKSLVDNRLKALGNQLNYNHNRIIDYNYGINTSGFSNRMYLDNSSYTPGIHQPLNDPLGVLSDAHNMINPATRPSPSSLGLTHQQYNELLEIAPSYSFKGTKLNTTNDGFATGRPKSGLVQLGGNHSRNVGTLEHEVTGHGIQMGKASPIDDELGQLIGFNVDPAKLTPKASGDLKYFLHGSEGMEPFAFAQEGRQFLRDMGLISSRYEPITPQLLDRVSLLPEGSGSGMNNRLFQFTKGVSPQNRPDYLQKLSGIMNKLPAAVPVIGTGAVGTGIIGTSTPEESTPQLYGGYVKPYSKKK